MGYSRDACNCAGIKLSEWVSGTGVYAKEQTVHNCLHAKPTHPEHKNPHMLACCSSLGEMLSLSCCVKSVSDFSSSQLAHALLRLAASAPSVQSVSHSRKLLLPCRSSQSVCQSQQEAPAVKDGVLLPHVCHVEGPHHGGQAAHLLAPADTDLRHTETKVSTDRMGGRGRHTASQPV